MKLIAISEQNRYTQEMSQAGTFPELTACVQSGLKLTAEGFDCAAADRSPRLRHGLIVHMITMVLKVFDLSGHHRLHGGRAPHRGAG